MDCANQSNRPSAAKRIVVNGQNVTEDLARFDEICGVSRATKGRHSVFLTLQLKWGLEHGLVNPAKVLMEIESLEGGGPSRTKPAVQNKHPPLKGLWHKHYMAEGMSSLATNLRNELLRTGLPSLERFVRDAREAGEQRYFGTEHVGLIVQDAVNNNWTRRTSESRLTGEWLLFAKHEGFNYYLCLGSHNRETHQGLRAAIEAICCEEFPFLRDLLVS